MWRHITGAPKRMRETQTPDEVKSQKKRKCCPHWRFGKTGMERTWLHYEVTTGSMTCTVCQKYTKGKDRKNTFVVGNKTMKLEAIVDHETSRVHTTCIAISQAQAQPLHTAQAFKQLTALSEDAQKKLLNMFRTVHALGKKARPLTDFEWICE